MKVHIAFKEKHNIRSKYNIQGKSRFQSMAGVKVTSDLIYIVKHFKFFRTKFKLEKKAYLIDSMIPNWSWSFLKLTTLVVNILQKYKTT